MRLQPIIDISEICARKGIKNAVLCPGSRNAPLTISFARQKNIECKTISDERSAAFVALGMAQAQSNPVALVCTSGSAAYNFAPAIAEAFYQHIPVLVLTADRPREWIDQRDGQTIRQTQLYGSHVKQSFELPQDYDHPDSVWFINRIVNEAINLANRFPKGPVHVNIPLREPLYPLKDEIIQYSDNIRIINEQDAERRLSEEELNETLLDLQGFNKVLIIAGQADHNDQLIKVLDSFSSRHHVPVVADVISNLNTLRNVITHSDVLFGQCKQEVKKALQPELIITIGKSVVSKNLKLFLREFKPVQHWHLQLDGQAPDTFQSLTKVIAISPFHFFNQAGSGASKSGFEARKRENYYSLWQAEEHRTQRAITSFFAEPQLSEFHLTHEVLKSLPPETHLHLANSMAVRYANFIGLSSSDQRIQVFSNRGTSGIDGCASTAVGSALITGKPTVLITGDMAMLYDRNAFWHNYKLPNLRVVVLNNHGGAIFSMIDGPADLPEADPYFITQQMLSMRSLATEFDFDYLKLDNLRKLKNLLKDFFDFDGRTKILELETSAAAAKKTLDDFKSHIKKNYVE